MNRATIVETTSCSLKYLRLGAYSDAHSYRLSLRGSDGYLTNHIGRNVGHQSTQSSLLEGVPYEILVMILESTDVKSFWMFAAANR
jgi:hypothetical protein